MAESQKELNSNRMNQLGKFAELLPEVLGQVRNMANDVFKDAELSCKVKRLMALAVALGAGCRNCVLGQAMYALENGATKEEILETISVVVSMRGTTGLAESLRVVQLLDELGSGCNLLHYRDLFPGGANAEFDRYISTPREGPLANATFRSLL